MSRTSPLLVPLFVGVFACGGGGAAEVQLTPFTPEHAEVFEDGIDFVADPEGLEGRWREDWSWDLDRRVTWADVIAIVTVRTVRSDTDPGRENTVRLVVETGRTLVGDPGEDLELKVHQDSPGYSSVEGNSRRILDHEFIAFIKWYETDSGAVAPHWHLAPSTESVVSRTEYLLERRREIPRERDTRTTTHFNEEE
jgi:hypothetical protein